MNRPFDVLRCLADECDWPPNVKMAYMVLYRHRDQTSGVTRLSFGRLATGMGVTPKVAVAAVQSLEELTALDVTRSREPGTKEAAINIYRLLPPWEAVQHMARVPRGKYSQRPDSVPRLEGHLGPTGNNVVPNRTEVIPTGNNVVPNGNEVIPNESEGMSQREQQVCPSGERYRPIDQAIVQANIFPDAAGTAADQGTTNRESTISKKGRRGPDPDSETVQAIVVRLDELLREAGQPGVESEKWGETKATVKNVLKGKGGDPAIPPKQALEALEWAWTQPGLRSLMLAAPARSIRSMWGRYLNRDNQTQKTFGNRYQDHNQYKAPTADPWA